MEEEFLKAIKEHQGIILKVCRMYCSHNTEAEDLFQEILLALWKAWQSFKSESKLSTWMYRIALNTSISRLRKSGNSIKFDELEATHLALPDTSTFRLDIIYDEELQTAISTLGTFDKAILMLYLDEKSYRDIAEVLGITESNVAVRINRIKKNLKEKITR